MGSRAVRVGHHARSIYLHPSSPRSVPAATVQKETHPSHRGLLHSVSVRPIEGAQKFGSRANYVSGLSSPLYYLSFTAYCYTRTPRTKPGISTPFYFARTFQILQSLHHPSDLKAHVIAPNTASWSSTYPSLSARCPVLRSSSGSTAGNGSQSPRGGPRVPPVRDRAAPARASGRWTPSRQGQPCQPRISHRSLRPFGWPVIPHLTPCKPRWMVPTATTGWRTLLTIRLLTPRSPTQICLTDTTNC